MRSFNLHRSSFKRAFPLPTAVRDSSRSRWLRAAVVACSVLTASCSLPKGGSTANIVSLPEVDSENAVRLHIRSKFNSSLFIHHHILRVDGARVGLYEESDRDTLLLTPGRHTIGLSCHSKNEVENTFDFNYRVSDGDASLDIEAYAGESICLGIGFKLLDCAVLEIAESSYCN